jgi:uncharacterized membrane protein YbhN (UPF0104 family)
MARDGSGVVGPVDQRGLTGGREEAVALGSTEAGRPILGWILGFGLLLGLVVITHSTVGWGSLLAPWTSIPIWMLILAFSGVLLSLAIRALRIQEYFQPATKGRFPRTFRLVLIHNLFNNLLPMRSGEASFPILMARQFRVSFVQSVPGLLYLRILDLHFVLFMGLSVLAWQRGLTLGLLSLLLAPIPLGVFLAQSRVKALFAKGEGRAWTLLRKACQGLPSTPGLFWRLWIWTAVNWSVKLLVFAWILRAFTPMPFPYALLGSTTGELSSVLPFHGIAGAGTYEAGVLSSLLPLGIELEGAISAAVNLHLFLLGSSMIAGMVAAVIPSKRMDTGENSANSGIFDK